MTGPGSQASRLPRGLVAPADFCRRHAFLVVFAGLAAAAASGLYISGHPGIDNDTDQMFDASLPGRPRVTMEISTWSADLISCHASMKSGRCSFHRASDRDSDPDD
jgi:hypothetical protein